MSQGKQNNRPAAIVTPTRRDILRTGSVAAAAAIAATYAFPSGVYAKASDRVKVGLVGCGGRGSGAAVNALTADDGAELVAICPQTLDYAIADVEKKQLEFPVLTDAHNAVARRYGLVFVLTDALKALQTAFGNPIPKFNGDDSWELPMPGTFVLDREGVVRLAHVDPDYTRRLEPAAILEALGKARSRDMEPARG